MCTAAMEHAFSAGGTDTLAMLSIERGYWRATPSSEEVLACFNSDACLGGVTGHVATALRDTKDHVRGRRLLGFPKLLSEISSLLGNRGIYV